MRTDDRKMVLVVASNRAHKLGQFLSSWAGRGSFPWDETVVIQDGDGSPFSLPALSGDLTLYGWDDIRGEYGGALPDWLSRRDSGIKCWGFLKAIRDHNADTVVVLDDDCLPSYLADVDAGSPNPNYTAALEAGRKDFATRHWAALYNTRCWTTTVPGFVPRGLPYGLPYPNGELAVALNMGLWEGVPDLDAPHALLALGPNGRHASWEPAPSAYTHSRVMSPRQYWPLCGMNFAFDRSVAPLMYFPRMGEGMPYHRFDDIWGGVLVQRCLRHLQLSATVGGPVIRHAKASDPLDNLAREAPAIRANEVFWRIVDNVDFAAEHDTPLKCMQHLGGQLANPSLGRIPPGWHGRDGINVLCDYVVRLGTWISSWAQVFAEDGWQ